MVLNLRFSTETEAKLRERSVATGENMEQIVLRAVEEKLAVATLPSNGNADAVKNRLEHWRRLVKTMEDWSARHLPPNHFVDDSRESIYP